mmetsp:Transcript_11047/g.13925  ORF Transcript_11047/g.13925 Transcript_11047/m.13925 type:complete len:188 (-) Transcript_11047:406-969(-)
MPGSIGKWVCDPHRIAEDTCLIYSIGSNGTYGFEKEVRSIISKDCEVHIFDPLNFKEEAIKVGARFHNWGIGNETESKTFKETITTLEHTNKVIDVMKIDCEGCEWSTHKDWIGFGARQILMETHGVPQPNGGTGRWYQQPMNVTDYFQDFKDNGYVLYNRDPNGLGMEMAFMKLDQDFHEAIVKEE